MKRSLYLFILLILILQACSVVPATELPTSAPTDTPVPTFTPQPTDTPTPEPTSTPDKTATAAVQATAAAQTVLDELDRLLGESDIPYEDGHLEWQQNKPLMVSLKGPAWDYVEIDDDLRGKDFILKTDVTWEASGIIICTVLFRSEPNLEDGKQYRFSYLRFSGLPAWEIGVYADNLFLNTPTKTQYSHAIDLNNGATNQVMLVALDDQFDLYVNGAHEGRYYDYSKQRTEGVFGFRGDQDSGEGTCNFQNSWIWTLE